MCAHPKIMTAREIVTINGETTFTIPDRVTSTEEALVRAFYEAGNAGQLEYIDPGFGHALSTLVTSGILRNGEEDPKVRDAKLRQSAQALVAQFGEKIIPTLPERLRSALE
jgi:hypothetical protein